MSPGHTTVPAPTLAKAKKPGFLSLRYTGKIARAFYCTMVGREIVILHSFIKKTQETPARELNKARSEAGLTQEEVAARMGTTKSAVSRLEACLRSPTHSPSFATLRKYAHACGKQLVITMV